MARKVLYVIGSVQGFDDISGKPPFVVRLGCSYDTVIDLTIWESDIEIEVVKGGKDFPRQYRHVNLRQFVAWAKPGKRQGGAFGRTHKPTGNMPVVFTPEAIKRRARYLAKKGGKLQRGLPRGSRGSRRSGGGEVPSTSGEHG